MLRKLLFILLSVFIISCFFLSSCENKEQIIVKNNVEETENKELKEDNKEDLNIYLSNKNELILENGDIVNVYLKDNIIVVDYEEDNKLIYSFDYYFTNNNLHIDFFSHVLVSTLTSDLSYLNNVSKQYIINKNSDTLTFSFNKGNEINIFSKEKAFNYNNLTNITIEQVGDTNFAIINLKNKEYCNDNNLILFDKNKFNEKLLKINNTFDINNLKCGKENILLFNNKYSFFDERDFSLFSDEVIINAKKTIFENLNNKDFYINTIIEDNYVYINLNNLDNFNYSLDYEYNEKQKTVNIIVNKIPELWISVDKIKFNKNIFYKIDKINIEQRNYDDYNGKSPLNKNIEDNYSLYSFKNRNGYYYSYINDMHCDYFVDQSIIEINDLSVKSNLILLNGKKKKCKKYKTKKIAIDYNKFSIIEKEINSNIYNLGLNDFFDIDYKNGTYYFDYKNDYKIFNYKVINNQLYLYIDKINNNYHILNKSIEKLKIEQFSNINIINLYNDKTYKKVLNDNLKVYRDYNEELKANIRKYRGDNNYLYYSLRFNSISIDDNHLLCNKAPFNINKVKEGNNAYSLIIKDQEKECNKSAIGLYIIKLIGSDIDIDFLDKRNNQSLESLKNKHDKEKFNINSAINNLGIDFEFDVAYVNNMRKFIVKVNSFNKNSRFFHTMDLTYKKNSIVFNIKETENLSTNEPQYFSFDTDQEFNSIIININKLEGQDNYKISLN